MATGTKPEENETPEAEAPEAEAPTVVPAETVETPKVLGYNHDTGEFVL